MANFTSVPHGFLSAKMLEIVVNMAKNYDEECPFADFFDAVTTHYTHQEIAELVAGGASWEAVRLLETNMASERKYEGIDAAIIHDACPVLYHVRPDPFSLARCCVAVDQWGHIDVVDEGGCPVLVAQGFSDDSVCKAFRMVLLG